MRFPCHGVGIFAAFVGVACVSDHDALARRDSPGSGGSGGSGGSAGTVGRDGGREAGSGDAAAGGADARFEAGEDAGTEPAGTNRLTLFHGAVDAPRIGFCAIRVADAGASQALEPIFPAGGLDYATPLALDALAGIDFANDGLQLIAVAADASLLRTTRCADALAESERAPADAGPDAATPPLRARGLPLLPAGTLSSGRSLLLVITGCFGAPDHDGPTRESMCGKGYTPLKPTLGMALVPMSRRTESGRLGLQLVHASRASEAISLVTLPAPTIVGPSHFVASEVVYGQIAPRPANVRYARLDFGSPLETSLLEVRRQAPGSVSVPWSEALARGGVGAARDGENLTVVFTGPLPGTSETWANSGTLTVVSSDPK